MEPRSFPRQIISIVRAGIIMPWIGFIMIIPFILPLLMLFTAPLKTMGILYGFGFVPSIAAATVHRAGAGRLHPVPLIVVTALSGGLFCLGWQAVLGMPVKLQREPNIMTAVAIVATAIYFTIGTLRERLSSPQRSH